MTSLSRATPLLPAELIDEILRDGRLGLGDLTRCCLVCRAWLVPARKSLYDKLNISLLEGHASTSGSDSSLDRLDSYHLDCASSKLFATLLSNSALGDLVTTIELEEFSLNWNDQRLVYDRVWRRPEELVAELARLCRRTKILDLAPFEFLLDSCVNTFCTQWSQVEEVRIGDVTTEIWEKLRPFENLKRLTFSNYARVTFSGYASDTFSDYTSDSPSPDATIAPLPLTYFHVRDCEMVLFEALAPSIFLSLRNLGVPTEVVPSLRLSHFPQLIRFTLHEKDSLEPVESQEFLEDLSTSKSLRSFKLCEAGLSILVPPTQYLAYYLPTSCYRVNLAYCDSTDSIVSVMRQSRAGHRIRELVLPYGFSDERDVLIERFGNAFTALPEAAHVELLLYN